MEVGEQFFISLLSIVLTLFVFCVVITVTFLFVLIRDFLPRGSGIVTRRPLILQLVNSNAGENTQADTQLDAHSAF